MNNLLALALTIGVIGITGYVLVYVLPNGSYAKYLFYASSQEQALRLAEHNGYNRETNMQWHYFLPLQHSGVQRD
jgi:hypothetical protein